jgi:hypothetical protein
MGNNGKVGNNASSIILVKEEPRGPSQLIEVPVNAATQKQPFPDIPQLRSQPGQRIVIKGIRLITAKVLTRGATINAVNAPVTELQKMTLVLFSQQWQKGQNIPVLTLNDVADGDSTAATTIPYRNTPTKLADWENVDWPQSFIQYANGTAAVGTPYVVIFDVEYLKYDDLGNLIDTPS